VSTRVQFGGDHDAFPLWGESGGSDINLLSMRRMLSPELVADLDGWSKQWATVDGGDADEDDALTDRLIVEARLLATRVADELGPDYEVSCRWEDRPR
jgi:hypothetical protein